MKLTLKQGPASHSLVRWAVILPLLTIVPSCGHVDSVLSRDPLPIQSQSRSQEGLTAEQFERRLYCMKKLMRMQLEASESLEFSLLRWDFFLNGKGFGKATNEKSIDGQKPSALVQKLVLKLRIARRQLFSADEDPVADVLSASQKEDLLNSMVSATEVMTTANKDAEDLIFRLNQLLKR